MSASSGHCLCGAVRFAASDLKPAEVCNCTMCGRWAGGPLVYVPAREVAFEDESALLRFQSSDWGERLSCRSCGSAIAWHFTGNALPDGSAMERPWDVTIGTLDTPPEAPLAQEIFTAERPKAYAFAGDHARHRGMPRTHDETPT